jgi:hypothetical protein
MFPAIQSIKISYKNREVQPKNGQIVGPPMTAGACLDNNLTIFFLTVLFFCSNARL